MSYFYSTCQPSTPWLWLYITRRLDDIFHNNWYNFMTCFYVVLQVISLSNENWDVSWHCIVNSSGPRMSSRRKSNLKESSVFGLPIVWLRCQKSSTKIIISWLSNLSFYQRLHQRSSQSRCHGDPTNFSLIAFKLLHKSAAIRPSTRATGKYGLGLTSTAYVNRMALPPGGEQPGSGCIRQTPYISRYKQYHQ